ncbi:hypothetical protein [Engelhardtia mirabilis]|uniref:Uncharacterized protein n=1 Tax=Engelhardtia mirabilis TaxID=2528011 RepID=A0A518BHR2_9BACT|nr:hypothetical protein Pla133_15950 [Planctomycetes bacterium Pla133]QDV00845.1 hypothetical protein Pla86_15940 [Planctomycetes bacterium Pla86]
MKRRLRFPCHLTAAVLAAASLASLADAHDGPPYPIFVDEQIGSWTLSIWTDPDVGTGTFYFYVDPPEGRSAEDLWIALSAAPADDGSPRVVSASRAAKPEEPFQQIGNLEFAYRGTWPTHFSIREVDSDEPLGQLDYDLQVTPAGLGALDILWFAFPFLIVGGIWIRMLAAQRSYDRSARALEQQ